IADFCTWRGLVVLPGARPDARPDGQYFGSGEASLWLGAIDDLWALGAPRGSGGPWLDTPVKAGEPSDPYLMTNYGQKRLTLRHDAPNAVRFVIEVDPLADGTWYSFREVTVPAGQTFTFDF